LYGGKLYAALEAPLFHGGVGFCGVSDFPARVKNKINVKGSGQECPLHTGKITVKVGGRVELFCDLRL
jgi:hypothetical protein